MRTLILTFLLLMIANPASAQVSTSQSEQPSESEQYTQGVQDGQTMADQRRTRGWYVGGFVGGLGLGPFGIGVSYAFAAESSGAVPLTDYMDIAERSPDFRLGFQEGYQHITGCQRERQHKKGRSDYRRSVHTCQR